MWTAENRPRYNRDSLRYPSDVTDQEWSLIAPLIPPAKHGGRKREVVVRDIVNGLMYVLSTGCQWRYVPKDLYLVHAIIRYLIGSIILKLSVTSSQYVRQLRGTSSRKNASMAMLKSLKLG